ncbi:hypothetical protein BK120_06985 [Paenibacillus sp. FSL A5-0031]|nr:hypothetical protein BK120_06985 [Paenibacillus sp. FSL A5-0031]
MPIHLLAWAMILAAMLFDPFRWFLNPIVNNTPAFLTVSRWLAQSLFITGLIGFSIYKLRTSPQLTRKDLNVVSVHVLFSIVHITVVSAGIFITVGFEDL